MCGRYTLSISVDEVWDEFDLEGDPPEEEPRLAPRFNVAPTHEVAVIAARAPRKLRFFRWGLVPHWAKDPSIGSRMINARAESVADKPSFRNAFARRRCIVLADGFYEWKREEDGTKTPTYLRLRSGRPFGFAGLWESWTSEEGDGPPLRSCTIITVQAEGMVSKIHHRMPVILTPETRALWLDDARDSPSLRDLLRPLDTSLLEAWEVSKLVNSPGNDVPQCIERVER